MTASTARVRGLIFAAVAAAAVAACNSSVTGTGNGSSATIEPSDTLLLTGEELTLRAVVQYDVGAGDPSAIAWGVSDTSVLGLTVTDLTALVTAKDSGMSYVVARINNTFRDSARVAVVGPGNVRWRRSLTTSALSPAIDGEGRILVGIGTTSPKLMALDPAGHTSYTSPSCASVLGPSVSDGDTAWTTGDACTRAHLVDGSAAFTKVPFGTLGGGVAVTANGGAVLLYSMADSGTVTLSRVSASGAEQWRDTLRTIALAQTAAPSIASNGDIYVAWRAPADSSWVSRVATGGAIRWTVPLGGWARYTSPAVIRNRIVVSYQGGVVALDTAGAVVWKHAFSDALPQANATTQPSSAVVDDSGNVYVQTVAGLVSFGAQGQARWAADSLGASASEQATGVGAPALLLDRTLVAPCGVNLCVVSDATGALARRISLGGGTAAARGLDVGADGVLYALGGGQLVALWGRIPLNGAGWSTEGGNARHDHRGIF